MKALTDKIIDKLKSFIIEPNSEFEKGIQQAINVIEWEESQADFEEVARVMMKHLCGPKYHTHHRVVLDSTMAELSEGRKCTGKVMDYVKD